MPTRLVGVTKGVCGDPAVARAMVDAGVVGIGDSRIENLAGLCDGGDVELTQLRLPMASTAADVVAVADRSLHSEVGVIEELGAAATRRGETHDVILMVDMGDGREGVLPDQTADAVASAVDCAGVSVVGIGTNFGCFGGVLPTRERLQEFVSIVEAAEALVDGRFEVVSGGSTATLPLVEAGSLPARINELRIGEGILLGTEMTSGRRIPYVRRDAFELRAEVIECKRKPPTASVSGDVSEQSGSNDSGQQVRAIVALGRQDTDPSGLHSVSEGIEVVGASSDHTVLDVTDATRDLTVGDEIGFHLEYRSLVDAFTSPYVGRTVAEVDDD